MKRPNPIAPRHMTAQERLSELADLLALGLIRLRLRKSRGVEDADEALRPVVHGPVDQRVADKEVIDWIAQRDHAGKPIMRLVPD